MGADSVAIAVDVDGAIGGALVAVRGRSLTRVVLVDKTIKERTSQHQALYLFDQRLLTWSTWIPK